MTDLERLDAIKKKREALMSQKTVLETKESMLLKQRDDMAVDLKNTYKIEVSQLPQAINNLKTKIGTALDKLEGAFDGCPVNQ